MRYLLKDLFLGIAILVVLFLTNITSVWAPDGTRPPHPGREARPGTPQQAPPSPEERTKEAMGVRGTLTINLISPREIYTNTPHITVSYNLSLSSPLSIGTIPVKVALFLDNQLKNTTEINNFPNGETRRLFISTPTPNQAKEYVVTLKAVRADVSNVSLATSREIYATATQRIRVNEALPDLVVKEIKCWCGNIQFTVANIGTAPMPSDWKYRNFVAKIVDRYMGARLVSLIDPTSGNITPPGGTASYLAPGYPSSVRYSVTIDVDAKNSITELDESNNSMTVEFIPCEPCKLNLSIGTCVYKGVNCDNFITDHIRIGRTRNFSISIDNSGASVTGDFTVGIYLNNDPKRWICAPTPIKLWQTTVTGGLKWGESKRLSATITIPETLPPGPYWLIIMVDDTNRISEDIERDNCNPDYSINLIVEPVKQ